MTPLSETTRKRIADEALRLHFSERVAVIDFEKELLGLSIYNLVYTEEQQELLRGLPEWARLPCKEVYFNLNMEDGQVRSYAFPLPHEVAKAPMENLLPTPDQEEVERVAERVKAWSKEQEQLEHDRQVFRLELMKTLRTIGTEEQLEVVWPQMYALMPEERENEGPAKTPTEINEMLAQ